MAPPSYHSAVISLLYLLLACQQARAEASCQYGAGKSSCFPALFNFGDSNSDTGGLSGAFGAAPHPNGITTFHKPSGRYCDGRLLIDFIAEEVGLPYLAAYLQSVGSNFRGGANFATAGSTIRIQNTTLSQSGFSPFSLGVQVSQFLEFKDRTLTFLSQEPFTSILPKVEDFKEALYVVDIGQNDLTAGYFLNLTTDQVKAYIPQVLEELSSHLQSLHRQGGAQYFLVITTGPVGCLPYVLTRLPYKKEEVDKHGCAEPYNEVARVFNLKLRATVRKLQKKLVNTTFVVADGYALKFNLFVNAKQDGFKETVKACCGCGGGVYNFDPQLGFCGRMARREATDHQQRSNSHCTFCADPSQYINWDGVHYTEAANHMVARGLFSGHFTTPPFYKGCFCELYSN